MMFLILKGSCYQLSVSTRRTAEATRLGFAFRDDPRRLGADAPELVGTVCALTGFVSILMQSYQEGPLGIAGLDRFTVPVGVSG